ncbi:MAG: putative DNA binding domain-containing protein [Paludibacteraceae bacterium]|nr:putative DNA binding domain-containing protein [Paludibacteraceae bacterium]
MTWKEKALSILEDSLYPVATELNDLDWKSGLSCKTERLAQHLCAFSNLKGGGLLVFGVNNDATLFSVTKEECDEIIQRLGNIAKNNLSVAITIEHWTTDYKGHSLLFIHIPEQIDKPTHLRGKEIWDSYTRSAGQTVKMSRSQIKSLIADSQGLSFEQRIAKENVTTDELLELLDYSKYFEMSNKEIPKDKTTIAKRLEEFDLCIQNGDTWHITNMGAVLFAKDISKFDGLQTHSVIVRKYVGSNNRELLSEQVGKMGYVVGFEGLVEYINKLTSVEEMGVVRKMIPSYPKIAIREFVANALIHQDFAIEGMQVVVEIFDNRISITNPGAPLHDVNRLLDLPPQSRNEQLAHAMFMLGICERRGSGIDRAVEAIEAMLLPAAKITKGENHTRVFLFMQKNLSDMTKQEKIDACYQHACLVYEDHRAINNQSVRERFGIDKNQSAVASRIIADTLEAKKIKLSDESITSKKYATYIPYYA